MFVTIEHRANLLNVDVIYAWNEDPGVTLTLTGDPQEIVEDYTFVTGGRRFKALASGEVGLEHLPGVYELQRIELYTTGGQTFAYEPQEGYSDVETDHYWVEIGSEEHYGKIYLSLEDEHDEEPE